MVLELVQTPAFVEVPIAGALVSRFYVDYGFALQWLELDDPVTLYIEQEFELLIDGTRLSLNPAQPEQLGPAFRLFRKEVAWAHAMNDGALDLRFTDGSTLAVGPGGPYEAWELRTESGLLIVSVPDGEIAIWDSPKAVSD